MSEKTRDAIRSSIFSAKNKKLKTKTITMFDELVEVRQPTLKQITAISGSADEKVPAIIRILCEYVFVPGTDTKVFDKSDAEQLASMPSGQWLSDFTEAINELTGVDVSAAEKNSEETS